MKAIAALGRWMADDVVDAGDWDDLDDLVDVGDLDNVVCEVYEAGGAGSSTVIVQQISRLTDKIAL